MESIESKLNKLEMITRRLARRSIKKISAMVTPYPISSCVQGENVTGDVLKYMFCAEGTITKGIIYLSNKPKVGLQVTVSLMNNASGASKTFLVDRKSIVVEPEMEVVTGDRLTVSVSPVDSERDVVTEVWIGFLWVPKVSETSIKSFLIDELEKINVSEE